MSSLTGSKSRKISNKRQRAMTSRGENRLIRTILDSRFKVPGGAGAGNPQNHVYFTQIIKRRTMRRTLLLFLLNALLCVLFTAARSQASVASTPLTPASATLHDSGLVVA